MKIGKGATNCFMFRNQSCKKLRIITKSKQNNKAVLTERNFSGKFMLQKICMAIYFFLSSELASPKYMSGRSDCAPVGSDQLSVMGRGQVLLIFISCLGLACQAGKIKNNNKRGKEGLTKDISWFKVGFNDCQR